MENIIFLNIETSILGPCKNSLIQSIACVTNPSISQPDFIIKLAKCRNIEYKCSWPRAGSCHAASIDG